MTITLISQETEKSHRNAEQRVILHNISWSGYEQILQILGDNRSSRLIYDEGTLEITMPLEEHESSNEMIGVFIRAMTLALGYNLKSMGSTTLNFPSLKKGAEPDKCYYIQNEPLVRGKTVDLEQDPPPNLVLEVDIIHSDINKFKLYGSMGIAEFWRYDGEVLSIYHLNSDGYMEFDKSPTFPKFFKDDLYKFLSQCQCVGESKALRDLQSSLRSPTY